VGESNYQPAIRAACNWQKGQDTRFECMAELVPEPTNEYDPNAVMVKIDGQCVGYLSRQDAKELGEYIAASIQEQGTGMVRAVIAGRGDGETDNLGVFLHVNVTRDI
jgi:collagen type III alpha